jgi:predicted nuclease of predicted toxin-antitoxin system
MRFKLDENLGRRGIELFREADHDTSTIADQQLTSARDETVLEVCSRETRCLVTLDLDFANPIRFPPKQTSGIAVLRVPEPISQESLLFVCRTLLAAPQIESISGALWIVEPGRIRKHASGT